MATRGASDRHQKGMPLDRDLTLHRTVAEHRGRTPRSQRDRAAIEEIPARDRRGFVSPRSAGDRRRLRVMINPQSWPDRDPILAEYVVFFRPL